MAEREVYVVVEHDGGWAYRVGATYSETFRTRLHADEAARHGAAAQRQPGSDADISYEDDRGHWHEERSSGQERPATRVKP